ncbi:Glycosyl transferase family 2 [Amycolatopsis xylanica]|uniref:Glycosyl transferase family 2 n=1 Tax=Amycolatopsis xylanica TaxID=589385 RepID=A0A1H3ATG7_9PSEU|nr:glycosyltransferase [Amycolatopsis xylanica]SDX32976.1 Glycosyl transferase family 2 [Amycolatopsis xylanica]
MKISVITAVYDGGHHFLPEAYESLNAQEIPDGWEWEWCVQEDGKTGIPASLLPNDPRIKYSAGLPGRAGVARTMALSNATGPLIRTLDADDVLLPGALARDIEALHRVAWCVSAGLDLHPDGTSTPGPHDPPDGPFTPGQLFAEQKRDKLSVMATTFAAHKDLVLALGGWTALTGAEGVGLLLAAEAVAPGEFIARPSLLYRKHDAQTTASTTYWDAAEHELRMTAVLDRAESLRSAGWRWSFERPNGPVRGS